jgi:hypothetical protein
MVRRKSITGADTYLILDQELHALNWSSSSLGHGGGNTTHCDKASARSIAIQLM